MAEIEGDSPFEIGMQFAMIDAPKIDETIMALQLRPNCEYCDKDLPPDATDARICSYECTFCADCVETKWFLAWDQQRIRWVCSSLMAAGKFKSQKVSEQNAPAHPYLTQRSARRPA